jgi:hypothetical protein
MPLLFKPKLWKNKIFIKGSAADNKNSLRNHINNLGVPARKLAVGLSAHSPRHARKLACLRAIRYNP